MTLLYLALAYGAGIMLGRLAWDAGLLGCGLPGWLWLPPLALLPFTGFLNHWQPRLAAGAMRWPVTAGFTPPRRGIAPGLVVGAALCVLVGGLRYAAQSLTPCWTAGDLAAWNLPAQAAFDRSAPQVTVAGYVDGFPVIQNDRQEVVVAVARLIDEQGATHAVTGHARLLTDSLPRYAYGDRVTVTGRLATPPDFEDFSYREYLARNGIHSMIYAPQVEHLPLADGARPAGQAWRRWAAGLRSRGLALLQASLPDPQASLAAGMLLGVEAGIPDALYERFHATGTSHVIVISGWNVTQKGWVVSHHK